MSTPDLTAPPAGIGGEEEHSPVADDDAGLPTGVDWAVEGRLVEASNVVVRMVGRPIDMRREDASDTSPSAMAEDLPRAVFKPRAGERPLSDFPAQTLAHREVATYLVARAAGLTCVPETRWFQHEIGDGSLQRWIGPLQPEEQSQVELLAEDEFDAERHLAIAAFDSDDGPLLLTHTNLPALRSIALLDVVTNNADRKGSHLIETPEGLYAIDHGLTFHVDDKLRTVLWGFAGERLSDEESAALSSLLEARDHLTCELRPHLSADEIAVFFARVERLRDAGVFPDPPDDRYGLPWPPI